MQTSSSYSSKRCLWTFNRALKLNQALKTQQHLQQRNAGKEVDVIIPYRRMKKGHAEMRRGIQVASSTHLSWSYHLRGEHMHAIVMSSVRLLSHDVAVKTSGRGECLSWVSVGQNSLLHSTDVGPLWGRYHRFSSYLCVCAWAQHGNLSVEDYRAPQGKERCDNDGHDAV